jgi:hypothetical protein
MEDEFEQMRKGIWPTTWARKIQKMAKKMSPEDLTNFGADIIRAEEAHR